MAKKHFYAIKNTGEIYTSWLECQEALKQVKAPVFKGFATKEEALGFLSGESDISLENSIFVDGSFNELDKVIGGAFVVIEDNKIVYEQKIRDDKHEELLKMRNVGGELLATTYAIKYALAKNKKQLTVCHDYQGIASWADGSWQAKQDITKRYRDFVKEAQKDGLELSFKKISAHTGVTFNERADELAKEASGLR